MKQDSIMSNERFTPKTLAEFYAACPFEGALPLFAGQPALLNGCPKIGSVATDWSWPEPKLQKKVIDMTSLVGSAVDCEFALGLDVPWPSIGLLEEIRSNSNYKKLNGGGWKYCRPRLNRWMVHDGGLCMIPCGLQLVVRIRYGREYTVLSSDPESKFKWLRGRLSGSQDVIAYKILGSADGWIFEWEKEEWAGM